MKKRLLFVLTVLLSARLFAFDFSLKLLPAYEFSTEKLFNNAGGFSVGLGADISPITIRGRDKLFITAQFASTNFPVKDFGIQPLIDGGIGLGYTVRILDRFSVTPEVYAGLWSYAGSEALGASPVSGLVFTGKVYADYYLSPALSVSAFGGFKSFYTKPTPFLNDVQVGVGIKYSLSKGLFARIQLQLKTAKLNLCSLYSIHIIQTILLEQSPL